MVYMYAQNYFMSNYAHFGLVGLKSFSNVKDSTNTCSSVQKGRFPPPACLAHCGSSYKTDTLFSHLAHTLMALLLERDWKFPSIRTTPRVCSPLHSNALGQRK